MRDLNYVLGEFILTDYATLDKRAEKLRKLVQVAKKTEDIRELEAIDKALGVLEDEKPVHSLDLTEHELKALAAYQLLTLKPLLIVLNIDEGETAQMNEKIGSYQEKFPEYTVTALCASMEHELAGMELAEAAEFMEEFELTEPAFDRVVASCFHMLGLKVFFTVGDDECRAWPVSREATAQECAGAIHSDLERSFVCAVTLGYDEFEAEPNEKTHKLKGRQEKKNYIPKDGDLMEIRSGLAKS